MPTPLVFDSACVFVFVLKAINFHVSLDHLCSLVFSLYVSLHVFSCFIAFSLFFSDSFESWRALI